MQDSIASSLTGINEIAQSLEDRKKEQLMLNLKSTESRLLSNSKKISNTLDNFKMFQLKVLEGQMKHLWLQNNQKGNTKVAVVFEF